MARGSSISSSECSFITSASRTPVATASLLMCFSVSLFIASYCFMEEQAEEQREGITKRLKMKNAPQVCDLSVRLRGLLSFILVEMSYLVIQTDTLCVLLNCEVTETQPVTPLPVLSVKVQRHSLHWHFSSISKTSQGALFCREAQEVISTAKLAIFFQSAKSPDAARYDKERRASWLAFLNFLSSPEK